MTKHPAEPMAPQANASGAFFVKEKTSHKRCFFLGTTDACPRYKYQVGTFSEVYLKSNNSLYYYTSATGTRFSSHIKTTGSPYVT